MIKTEKIKEYTKVTIEGNPVEFSADIVGITLACLKDGPRRSIFIRVIRTIFEWLNDNENKEIGEKETREIQRSVETELLPVFMLEALKQIANEEKEGGKTDVSNMS